ncbi:hypothetical protein LJC23_04380 [Desulfovibrio sp. OttesenSCG-928-I05]|nr:hypothetical protein [Desulfovibrio sp. OttesenSCG-928-I05]
MRSGNTMNSQVQRIALCVVAVLCLALGACATKSSEPYAANRAYRVGGMEVGTVTHVGETLLTEEYGHENVLGGAAVGGVAGAVATGGNPLGLVGGAALGAYAGDYVTEKTVRYKALTITVAMDNGDLVTVVQEEDDVYLPGDRVRILYERDRAQVRHM